jgi:tetratricopeptide (TPR) repeat protein
MSHEVKVWEENIIIPTYNIGAPEKNPMFLEKRVYQGSSGVVYPHAVIEKIYDEKTDKEYQAVFMENRFLKIMILPGLGGRIQMAYDKIKERHFIYYNQVIKPALVGLTGPWISGGIEFNWPQHHRPSTFEPVDHTISKNKDGSVTVWVNEVERMFRTKGMAGFSLYPDKAYIEIKGRLYNRTPFPQTFLWWANPAVKVNDHYQSVFPPDVYAVFDHGKRDVSSFPIAKGMYYKVDYSPGTDISRYKNIPVPTSYMAIRSKYDFIGGYEHDSQGGLLHIADHHVSPGKKQWTWGHGEFGRAWDKNLTDEDGPYIELMTGMFTDNQPDFSWLQPFEEKTFTQYFMPYSEVGLVKNATKDAVLNFEITGNTAEIKLYTTSSFKNACILLFEKNELIFSEKVAVSPEQPYIKQIVFVNETDPSNVLLKVMDESTGKVLVQYQQEPQRDLEIPEPAQPAKPPAEIENTEQLYLTGMHLEQYRHATYVAADYYEEALKRDSRDARNNNALGLWYLRRGQFVKAEPYFRTAIATLTQRNPNPYDGEAYYNLGWALKMQGRADEAYDAFYKCAWNDAWQHAAFLNLARIACQKQQYESALELIDQSLVKNWHSHTARHLKAVILRKLERKDEALEVIESSLAIDPFNFGCLFEKAILNDLPEENRNFSELERLTKGWVHNYIEYAFDYAHAGLYADAIDLLSVDTRVGIGEYPMTHYYKGWFSLLQGRENDAKDYFACAAALSPDFCFPNRIEDVPVLEAAKRLNPADFKAPYYLGNFWYDKRQYKEAIENWELSVRINDDFPTAHRNLSLAYFNKQNDVVESLRAMEKAFSLDKKDARVLMELDQLYKRLNVSHTVRLALLESHPDLVESRDDLYLERITLYNQLGQFAKAKELISAFKFHPWEGGEGKVVGQYLIAHIELAKQALNRNQYQECFDLLTKAQTYPDNLGEGKLYGAQENDIFYLKAIAYQQSGDANRAKEFFQLATNGISEPVQAIFYNDPQPDKIFYQGLAWLKLGDREKADSIFSRLVEFAKRHLDDRIRIDYFAVSLPDLLVFDADLDLRNKIHCLYLMGLGYFGLGNYTEAEAYFVKVLEYDVNHMGAWVHKRMLGAEIVYGL